MCLFFIGVISYCRCYTAGVINVSSNHTQDKHHLSYCSNCQRTVTSTYSTVQYMSEIQCKVKFSADADYDMMMVQMR